MYYLMTREFISQQNDIVSLILKSVNVEKIYLLGYTVTDQQTESFFITKATNWRRVSHYYMLLLAGVTDKCNGNAIQDKIENRCRPIVPVTAIVLDANQFKNWLQEGHPFAYKLYRSGDFLYDGGNITFEEPQAINEAEQNKRNETLLNQGINKAQEFLAGADLYRLREQNKMAAFMLHQATEQALITGLKIKTGLFLNTHNLDKLIRCCTLFSDRFAAIFPRNNDNEERLFQLLQKAYIDTRYKDDYCINVEHLLTLTERVRTIERLVKDVCSSQLKEFTISS